MKRVIGVETEFALAPEAGSCSWGDDPVGREEILSRIIHLAVKSISGKLPGVADSLGRAGYFLSNGSRVYRDGWHLEYATAETTSPEDAIHQILAGERLIVAGINLLDGAAARAKLALYKTNISYGRMPATFGCHENYSVAGSLASVRKALIPFICSRVIFTGAGGFDPHRPMCFSLSPRVSFLSSVDGGDRAIVNARDEPLGNGVHRRLHLTSGESLCSHLSMYLKLGTTALVVAMSEAGLNPAADLCPLDPTSAIRAIADDPTCRCVVPVHGPAGCASAVQIQRAYLQAARANLSAPWMPHWAPRVIERWASILDLIESGAPGSVARHLDWAIKFQLFVRHARDRGFSPEAVDAWDSDLDQIPVGRIGGHFHLLPQDAPRILQHATTQRLLINPCPLFQAPDSKWDQLAEVLNLRLQLLEIDTRFSNVSAGGIFNQLDAAGVLEHRLPEVCEEGIVRALGEAPEDTRAAVRSRAIRHLSRRKSGKKFLADWHRIVREDHRLEMSMPDPIDCRPRWRRLPKSGANPASAMPRRHRVPEPTSMIDEVVAAYQKAKFVQALELAQRLVEFARRRFATSAAGSPGYRAMRYLAWCSARLGLRDPTDLLDAIHHNPAESSEAVGDYLFIYRMMGFTPHEKIESWVQVATSFLLGNRMCAEIAEPLGSYYLARGDLERARYYLAPLISLSEPLRGTRARAALADVYRRSGDPGAARGVLRQMKLHRAAQVVGIVAHDVLPADAKLETSSEQRRNLLQLAYSLHERMNCLSGMIRVSVLKARCCGSHNEAQSLKDLIVRQSSALPMIERCPKYQSILSQWDKWTLDDSPNESGDFWWSM